MSLKVSKYLSSNGSFVRFPMAGFGVETEEVFSLLFSPFYFPSKYLAEKRLKIIERKYIYIYFFLPPELLCKI